MARLSALGEGVERLETVAARIEIDESGEELEYRQLSLRSPHDGRLRKVMIVALARKLLIALWRYLQDGAVPQGMELKPA